jgi:hypothetical protein
MPGAVHMRGPLDPELLRQSLERIVHRHEILRTRFRLIGEAPVQWVAPPGPVALPRISLEDLSPEAQTARLQEMMAQEASRPFDLSQGPLIRGTLVALAPERSALLLTIHHIVCDGWSIGVIARELGLAYDALLRKEALPLAPPTLQYGDYARWQRDRMAGEPLQELLGYWRKRLSGAPALLELAPAGRRAQNRSGAARRRALLLPKELIAALDTLAREESASLFMTLLAAFDVLLWRWSGQADIVVGTPVANRPRPELEPLVGLFVNTVAVRMQLSTQQSFRALLGQARRMLLED